MLSQRHNVVRIIGGCILQVYNYATLVTMLYLGHEGIDGWTVTYISRVVFALLFYLEFCTRCVTDSLSV